jgi:Ethanolamine utilization protein EutJ (predicted chaperonin)
MRLLQIEVFRLYRDFDQHGFLSVLEESTVNTDTIVRDYKEDPNRVVRFLDDLPLQILASGYTSTGTALAPRAIQPNSAPPGSIESVLESSCGG